MTMPQIADVAFALLVEMYKDAGANLTEAIESVGAIGLEPAEAAARKRSAPEAPQDEAANLTMLSSVMSGTGFRGRMV